MPNIEEIIQKAMADGAFDHLKGKGQPLSLEINPNADPEWELAFHILKENGFAPAFIEERQAIEQQVSVVRQSLQAAGAGSSQAWQPAVRTEFEAQIAEINKRIRNYNLSVPHEKLARRMLDADSEFARAARGE
ncbi:MAG: DUF1992 domain-containing protein [Anaerolineales bacterium]|nr:DUF1992 domain-containing protein [Anaerolineales bacterium]